MKVSMTSLISLIPGQYLRLMSPACTTMQTFHVSGPWSGSPNQNAEGPLYTSHIHLYSPEFCSTVSFQFQFNCHLLGGLPQPSLTNHYYSQHCQSLFTNLSMFSSLWVGFSIPLLGRKQDPWRHRCHLLLRCALVVLSCAYLIENTWWISVDQLITRSLCSDFRNQW